VTTQYGNPPDSTNPQHVLEPPSQSGVFLVVTVKPGAEDHVRDFFGEIGGVIRAVGFRVKAAGLSCVTGIGSDLWDRLFPQKRPAKLHPFKELKGGKHVAPSTPGDLLFHIRADRTDMSFELTRQLMSKLEGYVDVVDEVHAFRYFDQRDILGFVDGTANPEDQLAVDTVFVGDEDPDFTGSSYVIVQKYIHDLPKWNSITVEEQQAAFGRHKLSDMEFPDKDKAPDSHIVLNTITEPDGTERKIVRDNMVFGSVESGEFGTYFIGYAADPTVTETMLERMFLGDGDATHDRILDFSTALTGCLFFVPTADFLDNPASVLGSSTESSTQGASTSGSSSDHSGGAGTAPN
jgi:porphyrinogen peroxidase